MTVVTGHAPCSSSGRIWTRRERAKTSLSKAPVTWRISTRAGSSPYHGRVRGLPLFVTLDDRCKARRSPPGQNDRAARRKSMHLCRHIDALVLNSRVASRVVVWEAIACRDRAPDHAGHVVAGVRREKGPRPLLAAIMSVPAVLLGRNDRR